MEEGTKHFEELREDGYDSWEHDGRNMLAYLVKRKSGLENELEGIKTKIAKLGKVFGEKKQRTSRPKIKPILRRKLEEVGDRGWVVQVLVTSVSKELGVEESTVNAALKRWMSAEPDLFFTGEDDSIFLRTEENKPQPPDESDK